MGGLHRKLDLDLIARIESGWTPSPEKTLATRSIMKPPRKAHTYRAARRNAAIHRRQITLQAKRKALRAYARKQWNGDWQLDLTGMHRVNF